MEIYVHVHCHKLDTKFHSKLHNARMYNECNYANVFDTRNELKKKKKMCTAIGSTMFITIRRGYNERTEYSHVSEATEFE